MSKYFKPINFPEPAPEKAEPEPEEEVVPDLSEPIGKIKREIQLCIEGRSNFRRGAVQFPKGQGPVLIAVQRLETNPCKANVISLLNAARQDLGRAVAQGMYRFLEEYYPELEPYYG